MRAERCVDTVMHVVFVLAVCRSLISRFPPASGAHLGGFQSSGSPASLQTRMSARAQLQEPISENTHTHTRQTECKKSAALFQKKCRGSVFGSVSS
eukprot:1128548-Rhodomonas_salina.3